MVFAGRRKRRKAEAAEFEEARREARDDLVSLGEGIRALDLDVQMPDADPQARADYEQAVEAYTRADEAWEVARRPQDLEPVGAALEEGRWAMASAKARFAGQEPPERRPPCFFDPRHGPSSRDVEWSPPYGEPRPVPACEADAQRVERGDDPQTREVEFGGRRVPYWQAGPAYAPYAGGYYGGFGGVLPGLLIGSVLGSAMYPPVVYGDGRRRGRRRRGRLRRGLRAAAATSAAAGSGAATSAAAGSGAAATSDARARAARTRASSSWCHAV